MCGLCEIEVQNDPARAPSNWADVGAAMATVLDKGWTVMAGQTGEHKRHLGRFYACAGQHYTPPPLVWHYADDPRDAILNACNSVLSSESER